MSRRTVALLPLAILLLAQTAPAGAAAARDETAAIRAAIEGGRLIQARTMLESNRQEGASIPEQAVLEADLLMAEHRYRDALSRYLRLALETPGDAHLWTGAGLASLRLGGKAEALARLQRAVALPRVDWRAWNAIGVLLDEERDWVGSAEAYDRALALAPDKATIWNNRGYSLLLQRRFDEGLAALDRAAALDGNNRRILVNRGLARALTGHYPTARGERESAADWAARLNNAGYAAWLAGDRMAARSLLARAVQASEVHNGRALANLARVEAGSAQ